MLKQALSRSPYRVCCWRVAIPVQSHESIRNGWWPGDSVWHIMYFSLHTHLSFCFHFMKCFYLWSASDVWFWVFFLVLMTHFQIKAFGRGVTLLGQGPCSTLARTKLQLQQWAAAPGCPCRAAHADFLAPGWCSFPTSPSPLPARVLWHSQLRAPAKSSAWCPAQHLPATSSGTKENQ